MGVKKFKGKKKVTGFPKASLAKLSNKRLNKLAKQGKLRHKGQEKRRLIQQIHNRLTPEDQPHKKSENDIVSDKTMLGNPKAPEDIPLEEADYDYFATKERDFSFLSDVSFTEGGQTKTKRKRKKADKDDEAMYEKQPRKMTGSEKMMKMMLPIKDKQIGIIQQMVKVEQPEADASEEEVSTAEADEAAAEDVPTTLAPPPPPRSVAELFRERHEKVAERKQRIALLCSAVIEDPESNMGKLRELRLFLEEDDPEIYITVKKLAMVSLKEVFKDIIPDYRIRQLTDKEKTQAMKKEMKKLTDFEESLLSNYRYYLEFLECVVKGKPVRSRDQNKKKLKANVDMPKEASKIFVELSLRCLCDLLVSQPHFNFRTNIIATVVPFVDSRNQKLSEIACSAVSRIFKGDRAGEVSLEVIRLIGRIIKARHFDVQPKVLRTFLSLKIKEVEKSGAGSEGKTGKNNRQKFSRRERKRKKEMMFLEKELQDAAAEENKGQTVKLHTQIINMVFLTYFRILKQARHSILLSEVMEGLAKFAHLINLDFFDDLFAVMNDLVDSGELTYRESLHCVQTAFTILSGQGSALNIDPFRFYTHLYRTLFKLHAGMSSPDLPIALQCMDIMLNKRRKQVSHQRSLAFIKRLVTLALQLDTHGAMGVLAATRGFLHGFPRSDLLLDTDSQGSGLYLPELDEPEHCNAHNTALYELHLLRRHYHPAVRKLSDHLLVGAPSHGSGALPAEVARKTPMELYTDFDPSEMTFKPAIDKKPKRVKKYRRPGNGFIQSDLASIVAAVEAQTDLTDTEHTDFCRGHYTRRRIKRE